MINPPKQLPAPFLHKKRRELRKLCSIKLEKTGRDPHSTESKTATKASDKVVWNQVHEAAGILPSGSKGQIPSQPGWHPACWSHGSVLPFLLPSGKPALVPPEYIGPKQSSKMGLGAQQIHRQSSLQQRLSWPCTGSARMFWGCGLVPKALMLPQDCSHLCAHPHGTAPLHSTGTSTAACCYLPFLLP